MPETAERDDNREDTGASYRGPYIMSRNLGFIGLNKELRKVTIS